MKTTLFLLALALSGCFSSEEGEALRRDVDKLKAEISKSRSSSEEARKRLQKIMEKATALLTRNSADVGAQVERIQNGNSKLAGQVDELKNSIAELNQKTSQLQAKIEVTAEASQANATPPPPKPQTKDDLFSLARRKISAGQHVEGRRPLRQFLTRFADDPRAPKAQKMLGDSYYVQQKFAAAIVEYRKVLESYKKHAVAAEALYKVGMAFYQLKFCGDAKDFLNQFVRQHRRHREVKNAKKLLKLIRLYRRNKQFCRS